MRQQIFNPAPVRGEDSFLIEAFIKRKNVAREQTVVLVR